MNIDMIRVRGARTNNLRDVDVDIPKGQLVVISGVSGSGKSSLAFATIAAESQRLLNQTYPAFVQNLMPHLPRPDVETLSGLSASIVVDQAPMGANPRSTVGTATDAWSLLRQLFAQHGAPAVAGPGALSFNDPAGMCPDCNGSGRQADLDVDAILDRSKSLNDGAITFPNFSVGSLFWKVYARCGAFDNDLPINRYSDAALEHLLRGSGPSVDTGSHPMAYEGILTKIERLYLSKDASAVKPKIREALEVAATTGPCAACHGSRLNPPARTCAINNTPITACHSMPTTELTSWLDDLGPGTSPALVAQLRSLLANLDTVGLGYLALERPTATLSGGEAQRIRTVLHLDSALTDLTYIFDEPAAGLHPHDTACVTTLLQALRDKGNTVLVVEHHPDIITAADHVIDMGPGAGPHGGTIVHQGDPASLLAANTPTGRLLGHRPALNDQPRTPTGHLPVRHATRNNLHDLDLDVPLGMVTLITGVAGAGKTSLLNCLPRHPDLVLLDQRPIRGSRRSTPASYTGALDAIRDLFATANHVKASLFSANSAGACPDCNGLGVTYLDTATSDPVPLTCPTCAGDRYTPDVLRHTYQGLTIAQVLNLPISQAAEQFAGTPAERALTSLIDVGLGYLGLGQPLTSLSGGERQRLRLSIEITRTASIYVLDEPTTGLHLSDVATLNTLFHRLADTGKSVIVADHHLDLIAAADHVIDLGPDAGPRGGQVQFHGTPQELAKTTTHTGRALAHHQRNTH